MSDKPSTFRLYIMRALYLLNFVLLGSDVWPAILRDADSWDALKGATFSLWAALSLLSGLGLRYPVQMLPLLLFQFAYKAIWLLAVALPQWSEFRSGGMTQAMAIGIVLDVIAIPWAYVFANYVAKRGDRWRADA